MLSDILAINASKMHLITFDPDFNLIWRHPTWQQGKISSEMFADINNPSCLLFHKHACKS